MEYVSEIRSITDELKRLTVHIKNLREQKKRAEANLYTYMTESNLVIYDNIKIATITPKPPRKVKPKKERRKDAIELFSSANVADPGTLWDELQKTQKYQQESS